MFDLPPPISPNTSPSSSDYPSYDSDSSSSSSFSSSQGNTQGQEGRELRPVLPLDVVVGLGEGNRSTASEGDQVQDQEQPAHS